MNESGIMAGRRRWTSPVCTAVIMLSLLMVSTPAPAAVELHVANEFSLTYNDVTGPGSNQSSLTEGFRYLDVFNFTGNGNLSGFDYNFNLGIKATDDRTNDPKTWSLTNLQGRATNGIHTLNLGDTFESFSQYALGTALKGGSYRFFDEKRNLPELTLVYGYAYPRWDSIYGDAETKAIERAVMGVRLKQNFSPLLNTGISFTRSSDREGSRIFASDKIYDNNQYTIDGEYKPIPGLTLTGELSFSDTTESPQVGDPDKEYGGEAWKLSAVGDGGPSRVTLEFERVSPQFTTLVGSATADREKVKAKWRYKYSKNVTTNLGFLWYRDNLNGDKGGTTHHYKPDVGVTFRNLLGRSYSTADLTYRYDRAVGENKTSTSNTQDHTINLNYRDRFGFFDSETNLGYSSYDAKTDVRNDQEFLFNTALSSRHSLGKLILKPSLYLGGRTQQDELKDTRDKMYEYSLGLGADIAEANITSTFRVGQNHLEKDVGDSSRKFFAAANVYWRPKLLAKLNQGMLYLRAAVNDFNYTTAQRDFRETSLTAGLNIQY